MSRRSREQSRSVSDLSADGRSSTLPVDRRVRKTVEFLETTGYRGVPV